MAPPQQLVVHAAGTLPGFRFGRGRKLQLVGDARRAKTGVYNSFGPLMEEEAAAAPADVPLVDEEEAVVTALAGGPPAAVDAAPAVVAPSGVVVAPPAAVADAPRWSGVPWVVIAILAFLAWALVCFALLPVPGGSRLLSANRG
ncbi:unnamed protein product [Urochloa humidicola]